MSSLTGYLPFSVFEILMVLIAPAAFLVLYLAIRRIRTRIGAIRFLFGILSIPAFIFSGFVFALGIPYHTTPLGERMELRETPVNAETLSDTALAIKDEINVLAAELGLGDFGASDSGMDLSEISLLVTEAYTSFSDEYGFPFNFYTRAKPMLFDEVMSRAHLLGIYTFFSGESNVNDAVPDYSLVYTVAHEFAHQRGIIREDEANFMAFATLIRSDHPYLRYAGYLNMYEYVINALYTADEDAYREIHGSLTDSAFADMRAYYEYAEKYAESKLGDTVSNVNDAYLQLNGTEGRISYSLCVRLAVAYCNGKE